jgi:hypothetical protein
MLLVGAPSMTVAASFDCDRAATETEIAICNDPELSALDELMGEIWVALDPSDRVVAEQRTWLEQRDDYNATPICIWDRGQDNSFNRCLRDHYEYRIYELVTGCSIDLNLIELRDEQYPIEELNNIIEASIALEDCIDDHYRSISGDFEAISNSFSILPKGRSTRCVIGFEVFMYPISERVGHSVYSRCTSNQITRYQILHDAMLDLIAEKLAQRGGWNDTDIAAILDEDLRNWSAFSQSSCSFFEGWGLHAVERVSPNYCRLDVIKFRLLYLSPWIGIDEWSGEPARSIEELLGPYYGLH